MSLELRHLAIPEDASLAVGLSASVWGGDLVVGHVLLTAAHNGGLLAGAFVDGVLVGFVWGFLGFDYRTDPPRLKHCSHQLGVDPRYRNHGLGFLLKRFQWEFVRDREHRVDHLDLRSAARRDAHLNIAGLGAVCNTYRRDEYGRLHDDLNAGPADQSFPGGSLGELRAGC